MPRTTTLRHAAAMGLLVLLCGCLSDRPLKIEHRFGEEHERADDAVGFVSVSTPLFTPLDEAIDGKKRLSFDERAKWEIAKLDLTAASFGTERLTYDMFNLALAVKLQTINQKIVENVTTKIPGGEPVDVAPESEGEDAAPNTRSETTTFESATKPDAITPPALDETIKQAMAELLSRPGGPSYSLPPDVLATLAASLHTYMVNLEEFYNVEGFDYRHGLAGRYVPYKVHFTVTAEPGWYSRYLKYDAVVDVELSLLREAECRADEEDADKCADTAKCDDEAEDEIVILQVSPIETAQSITEFAAAMTQFGAAVQASGSASSDVAFNAETQRLSLAAQRLEGARAHKTFVVGFPKANRMRVRFIADRVGTDTGRDLQPVSRVLTATVLVPANAAGRLDARLVATTSRKMSAKYGKLSRSKRTAATSNRRLRSSLAESLEEIEERIRKARPKREDPFIRTVFRQAAEAVRNGEDPSSILLPLVTLLRQEAPKSLEGEVRDVLRQLAGTPTLSWDDLFKAFDDVKKEELVRDAFRLAARRGTFREKDGTAREEDLHNALTEAMEVATKLKRPFQYDRDSFEPVYRLAGEIKDLGRERFETNDAVINARLGDKVENKRAWLSALTFQVIYRMFLMEAAFEDIDQRLRASAKKQRKELKKNVDCVEALLRGARCSMDVSAYFTPTMFGADGDVSPPRDYWWGVNPSDRRVLAADLDTPRIAPIPPWMGPLDERLEILAVDGSYSTSVIDAQIQMEAEAAAEAKKAKPPTEPQPPARVDVLKRALAQGRAFVRVRYAAPPMILDAQEKLIHLTDVYARVLGLQSIGCDASRCAGDDTGNGPAACSPGSFCRLLTGRNDTVIEVLDVDLSEAVTLANDAANLLGATPIRAMLQIVLVPKGVKPEAAWLGGTAQIVSHEVILAPQAASITKVPEPSDPEPPTHERFLKRTEPHPDRRTEPDVPKAGGD